MLISYIRFALRSILKNKSSSIINIGGLAVGMAVAMLIGFWIYDEWSFDRHHENYSRIAQVMENQFINGAYGTQKQIPIPVAAELRKNFGNDFKQVVQEYGKTVGLLFVQGRDFRSGPTGSDAITMILSESTVKGMGLKQPVGKTVEWSGYKFRVIGVIKDMIMESPYGATIPTIFYITPFPLYTVNIKINPKLSAMQALSRIRPVFSKYSPAEPFDYKFADEEYDAKFRSEERVGKLAGVFAILAVFISCLGLFGLASFVAEQRTKEIGVRKVLGACSNMNTGQRSPCGFLLPLPLVQS